jgi:small redox-active disulfide protein 2
MEIKILSSGCANCIGLEKNIQEALKIMKIDATIIKIENVEDILKHGVSMTPALVVNDKVRSVGKVLTHEEIREILENENIEYNNVLL